MRKVKPTYTERQIAEEMRRRISYALSQNDLARELGISYSHLSEVLAGKKKPGPAVLRALGYDPSPRYAKVGTRATPPRSTGR